MKGNFIMVDVALRWGLFSRN